MDYNKAFGTVRHNNLIKDILIISHLYFNQTRDVKLGDES